MLTVLVQAEVRFVVIGGVALVTQGGARATFDLDICYERSPGNFRNLEAAMKPFTPKLRGSTRACPSSSMRVRSRQA